MVMQSASLALKAPAFVCGRCRALQKSGASLSSQSQQPTTIGIARWSNNCILPRTTRHARQQPQLASRSFHVTPRVAKKKGASGKATAEQSTKDPSESTANAEDPFDCSELEDDIAKAHTRLKDDLSKLRAGGKFNPEVVENLRVQYDKSSKDTARLADLAQCVPRGRVLNIIAGEKEYLKAISSAIQSSNLSLTPQPDAQNPLQLNIHLPPTTAESRKQAVQDAVKLAEAANVAVKNARAKQHKKLRAMQQAKTARPDDLKKAGDKMEKVVTNGNAEVKKILDSAKKILESG